MKRVKKICFILLSAVLLVNCTEKQVAEESKTQEKTLENKKLVEIDTTDFVPVDYELSTHENQLIQGLRGNYFDLKMIDGKLTYEESWKLNDFDFQIIRKLDDVNLWEIYSLGSHYDVFKVEKKGDKIIIHSFEEEEVIFYLYVDNKKEEILFHIQGYRDDFYLIQDKDVAKVKSKSCSNATMILKNISFKWFTLTAIDGEMVLFEPCEEVMDGMSIANNSVDFWSGSDPYPILSVEKLYENISIFYKNSFEVDTLVFQSVENGLFKIGAGKSTDPIYVSDKSKSRYKIVSECE